MKYTINEIKELIALGFTPAQIAQMNAENNAPAEGKKPTGAKAQPKAEKTETFVKMDGTEVACTPAQKQAWEAYRNRSNGKTLDEVKAEWEEAHKNFKPSKELKDALKAKPTMTRKEAAALGFIGTKDELKALKAKLKVYDK